MERRWREEEEKTRRSRVGSKGGGEGVTSHSGSRGTAVNTEKGEGEKTWFICVF